MDYIGLSACIFEQKDAPGIFQGAMDVPAFLKCQFGSVHLDDIVAYFKFPEEHIGHVAESWHS